MGWLLALHLIKYGGFLTALAGVQRGRGGFRNIVLLCSVFVYTYVCQQICSPTHKRYKEGLRWQQMLLESAAAVHEHPTSELGHGNWNTCVHVCVTCELSGLNRTRGETNDRWCHCPILALWQHAVKRKWPQHPPMIGPPVYQSGETNVEPASIRWF